MANILIATLGDHPAVVTGMVKMLKAEKDITLDEVAIFHTEGSGKLISLGYDLVEAALKNNLFVVQHKLPFADPASREESIQFLRCLSKALNDYEQRGDTVYLSLAGGRKNMSALMAVICQFYPSVKGLFHLITHSDSAFPSIEQLFEMPEEKRRAMMEPPEEEMTLVEIPYQTLSNAVELRRYFAAEERGDDYPVGLSPSGEQFLREVFQPTPPAKLLPLYFTETAWAEVQKLATGGGKRAKNFMTCFEQMQDPVRLKGGMHASRDKFAFYKRRRTAERPFFYTEPNPIHLFPNKSVEKVVVCGLSVEQDDGSYQPDMDSLLKRNDLTPAHTFAELSQKSRVLLVPLGESPMVASQTYTLLQQAEREWEKQKGVKVVALYPEQNGPIKNGIRLLEKAFKYRKVDFQAVPIAGLRDVDSYQACEVYRDAIIHTIANLRRDNPDKQIALSLSGGRKGMSALTLFAAQGAGVSQVYHTTITDPDYEQKVLQETTIDKLPSDRESLAQTLFLDKYDLSKFTLFEIPVINLSPGITP